MPNRNWTTPLHTNSAFGWGKRSLVQIQLPPTPQQRRTDGRVPGLKPKEPSSATTLSGSEIRFAGTSQHDAQFDARFEIPNWAYLRGRHGPECERSELAPNTRIFGADRKSACSHLAESIDLQEVHAGGGTRTPDTRIMMTPRRSPLRVNRHGSGRVRWAQLGSKSGVGRTIRRTLCA
jgi:hypothetical protein